MPLLEEINKDSLNERILTYNDIDSLPEGLYEIIDGRIVEVSPTGILHGLLEGEIYRLLYDKLSDKGYILVGEVGVLITKDPLRIRGADIVYISKEKLKSIEKGILKIPPDLIVEIVSPSDSFTAIELSTLWVDYGQYLSTQINTIHLQKKRHSRMFLAGIQSLQV